jgi:hypothetical protein
VGNSRGARKLARTPHVNKKKKKEKQSVMFKWKYNEREIPAFHDDGCSDDREILFLVIKTDSLLITSRCSSRFFN